MKVSLRQRRPGVGVAAFVFLLGSWIVAARCMFDSSVADHTPWYVLAASAALAAFTWQQMVSRRQAEARARLMTSDLERMAMVVKHTSNAVTIADPQMRITWVNEAFTRVTGYSFEEALGKTPGELLSSGTVAPETLKILADAVADGASCRVEIVNRAKDGRLYWIDTEVQPMRDPQGRLIGFMEIGTDITAAKDSARELARGRQRLENIIQGTDVGTWEWDIQTGATKVSERWAQIVGYKLEELAPVSVETWHRLAHREDLSRSVALQERHFDGLTPTYECELRMRHKSGQWVWVLARGKLFGRDGQGNPRWMAGTHMDITERKHAEEALRASQAFLDRAGRIAGVGGWSVDFATRAIQWTDETCRIHDRELGHQPTFEEDVHYYPPEARKLLDQAWREAVTTGKSVDLELPMITARGRRIWVRAVGEVEFVGGKPARMVGALQDITARRAIKEELRHNNELMSSVLENLPCGLSVFDADLNLVVANTQFRRVLDFPDSLFAASVTRFEDMIRFNAQRGEYGTQRDVESTVEAVVARARGQSTAHQFERVRPDGTALEIRGGPLPTGGFVTTYTDVSERKRAERELQQRERLMRLVIDSFPGVIAHWDTDLRCTMANRAYLGWMGLDPQQMVGRTQRELIGEELFAQNEPHIRAALRGEPQTLERSRVTPDGRTVHYQLHYVPELDGDQVRGFISVVIDLTAMKEIQLQLQERSAQAEHANLAKSQFLANMSHEIRTPMNAILGMLALLRKTALTTRQADYASKTEGAARSLLGLLNDILDFSKVEAGKMTLELRPFRTDQLMRDLAVILSANVASKNIEVLFDIDPAVPRVLVGDAMRLQQVLINLGGNAVKFTTEGEVVLSMSLVRRDTERVTLAFAVRDTGIGIAPQNHARIFSGFTQAEASTTRRFGGTGLGVAISQRLVAMMGGELRLESALGHGSKFHFQISLDADQDGLVLPPRPASVSLRALVVDDNAAARELLVRMGRSLGWSVDAVDSGDAALTQIADAADNPYEAVFVDWQMPGLDGWQTSRRIRESQPAAGAPIVVMITANGREMLSERSDSDQALLDGFLVKPVTASMLFDAVVEARAGQGHAHPSRSAAASGLRRLAGMRLLVAEDNPNNQQVARELLEDEGATVMIANHGQEAVDAIAAADSPFDVVLMDLQMPVMDGFSATSRIRQDLGLMNLPIVAMTANAMASDREACLAAGMNDHVGKPFDLNHLVRVLLKHARPMQSAAPDPDPDPVELDAAVGAAATAAGVDLPGALQRLGGRRAVYRRMLQSFATDLASMPALLRSSITLDGSSDAARVLHTLKGLAATLGAAELSTAAAQAETRMKTACDPAEVESIVHGACAAMAEAGPGLGHLLAALDAVPSSADAAPAAALDGDAFAAALRRLSEQLQDADMAATDTMANLQMTFGALVGARLQRLDEAVNALDFERALGLCLELMRSPVEGTV